MRSSKASDTRVAIIGGGPAGLVAARYLKAHGFHPVVFEQSDRIGGQWNARGTHSGIWPGMRTNTSRVMTRFSDVDYPSGTAVYPTNDEVLAYLRRYAEHFELTPHVRPGTRVEGLTRGRSGAGWEVRLAPDGAAVAETYPLVVVASGRFNRPRTPLVPGLESFSGAGGAAHAFQYKNPDAYRGMRVLVAGSAISALEIAGDLAMLGAGRVLSSYRRQRYVLTKLAAGVPTDHLAFTRAGVLARESLPAEAVARELKQFVLRTSGSPEQFGAFRPADDIFEAGLTLAQHYLPLVAEGRIVPKPWMSAVDGRRVRFTDGTEEEVDALIFGTGYDLGLPFLGGDVRRALDIDEQHLDLHQFTFHPELEGLAFLGMFDQAGPYFPVLELQARWIAYAWADVVAGPGPVEMARGLAAYRARRGADQKQVMHMMAVLFARAAGVEPDVRQWPRLARALLFGPLAATSFRLSGPDALADAAERYAADAASLGGAAASEFEDEELALLRAVEAARGGVDLIPSAAPNGS
jgi:cation diffusion facilitator CzcD-associated flavoprotein CzcO